MLVKEVMKTAIGVEKDITLKRASEIMSEKNITSLFIVEGATVVGILDEGDMVEHFGKKKKVSEVMTRNVISISPEEDVEAARRLMTEKKIDVIPVVDPEQGLVGVIAAKDILREACETDHFLVE